MAARTMQKGQEGHDARIRHWIKTGATNEQIALYLNWPLKRVATHLARLGLRRSPREASRQAEIDESLVEIPQINPDLHKLLQNGREPDEAAAAVGETDVTNAMAALRARHLRIMRNRTIRKSAYAE